MSEVPVDGNERSGAASHRGAVRFAKAQRKARIAEMLATGATYQQMADEFGVSRTTVWKDAKEVIAALPMPAAEEWRRVDLERLDHLWEKLQPGIERGDDRAITAALRVLDRRARFLGLDAPTRVDATVHEVTQEDLAVAELIREAQVKEAADKAAATGTA